MQNTRTYQRGLALSPSNGFTLIELLVVIAIIGILSAVVLASLGTARSKGNDGAAKQALEGTRVQGELYYYANANSYATVCTGTAGTTKGINAQVLSAAKAEGLSAISGDGTLGTNSTATCHDSAAGWGAEVPLSAEPGVMNAMFCADSTGMAKVESGSSFAGLGGATAIACK